MFNCSIHSLKQKPHAITGTAQPVLYIHSHNSWHKWPRHTPGKLSKWTQTPLTFPAGNHSWRYLTLFFSSFIFHLLKEKKKEKTTRAVRPRQEPQKPWRGPSPPALHHHCSNNSMFPRHWDSHQVFLYGICLVFFHCGGGVLLDEVSFWKETLQKRNVTKPKWASNTPTPRVPGTDQQVSKKKHVVTCTACLWVRLTSDWSRSRWSHKS